MTTALPVSSPNALADLLTSLVRPDGTITDVQVGHDGLGHQIERRLVECRDSRLEAVGERLAVTFVKDGAQVQWLSQGLGLPVDWAAFESLEIQVVNGPTPLRLHAMVVGKHCRLWHTQELAAGQQRTLSVDLDELPLAQSKHSPYSPVGLRLQAQWGDTWPTEGALMLAGGQWSATVNNAPARMTIVRIELVARPKPGLPPVLDRFGQRLKGEWPGKIRSEEDLHRRKAEEQDWFRAHPVPDGRDQFGGSTKGPRFAASGFFRVERDAAGRWWYVTPEGNPFWSFGPCCVNPGDMTIVTGREHLFAELPPRDGLLAQAWGTAVCGDVINRADLEVVSFPKRNILMKWGSLDAWYEHNLQRIAAWGMNTVANWSVGEAHRPGRIPYTAGITTRFAELARIGGKMPDVYDPIWAKRLDAEVARAAERYRSDPWVIGYFSDNEMAWLDLIGGGLIDGPADGAARAEFVHQMRRFYRDDLAAFNRDWKTTCADWSALTAITKAQVPREGSGLEAMTVFAADYSERYFATVRSTLKRHDPDHIYLGCRFVRTAPHAVICAAAGRHCDVVSINSYALTPSPEQFGAWYRAVGERPLQLGEFNLPLRSPYMVAPGWPALTAEERSSNWPEFVRRWVDQPWSVGSHFFQLLDMPGTGRPFGDSGNGADSLIDITDTPHPDVVEPMRVIGENIYAWRGV